ncbi:MAG: hypothetical protein ABI880_07125, partial [Acidobacteriota bacterium]
MIKHTLPLLLVVAATASGSAVVERPAAIESGVEADVVIRGISLIDVRQGLLLPDRDIVVRGTRIASVAPAGAALPPAKTVIEGRGKYALPGLIDPHVRLADVTRAAAALLLTDGVTAVRDIGTEPGSIAQWRRALAYGQIYAPRIARACDGAPTAEPGCGDVAPPGAPALAALLRALVSPGPGLHDLLEQLVRAGGVTSRDALRAATLDAALLLALPDLGEL